jgi:NAD(P)H-flavin reductase
MTAQALMDTHMQELYYPEIAQVTDLKRLTEKEMWIEIELPGKKTLGHQPGQFVQVSLFGVGEAPISVTSSPTKKDRFELCIRRVGMLTEMFHKLKIGAKIGIRGPYGIGFDANGFKEKDILIIGGGIGIVPLRSLINYISDNRDKYGRLIILYGAKDPSELLFKNEISNWNNDPRIESYVSVDRGTPDWDGNVGVITTLIPPLDINLENTVAAIVGPPVMYKFVLMALKTKRFPEANIYISLERRMKCGVGKCGHCQINHSYVCQEGPVYHYPVIKCLEEAI